MKFVLDKNLETLIHLVYSNSDSDFALKKELEDWGKKSENIKVDFFDSSKSGHLDGPALKKLVSEELNNSTFWIVGPPAFVSAMEDVLEKLKVDSDRIKSEKFTGY
jgi:predicted ferric reductase